MSKIQKEIQKYLKKSGEFGAKVERFLTVMRLAMTQNGAYTGLTNKTGRRIPMKKRLFALCLALAMMTGLLAGCGSSTDTETATAPAEETTETQTDAQPESAQPVEAASETPAQAEAAPAESEAAPAEEEAVPAANDFTKANAQMDFSGYREMLRGLTTTLPITDQDVTLDWFMGFEGSTLNYMPDGTMESHQVWTWLRENTGVNINLNVVDKTNETTQFNLIIASGDFPDVMPGGDYAAGVEAAYEEEIFLDLSDYVEENMPNYWTIIHSDQTLLSDVTDGGKLLAIYAVKDQVANPSGIGTFIRKDWLDDLGLDVPQTYDELTDVLRAFKTEKGATEPMSLFNTVSMQNGLLMGGFGVSAELSSSGMDSSALNAYYQEDGQVIYGATADGTRKFLSWLHQLYNEDLINFDNMLNRETNPFSDLNAGEAANGSTGYIFSNQPFGGNYSVMAASQYGDENCNWWPVQDVAEVAGEHIPFYEEVNLVDMTSLAISTQCENVDVALQFLDFGYSYEGSLLYNFGFEIGSGHDVETWYYDENGEPVFDGPSINAIAATNIASGVIATKDLAGVVFDTRLSFEFDERELSCMDAWSTNKSADNILGSVTQFTAEEGTTASAIYSDILTYVGTTTLQFINGDLDIDDDTAWNNYVATIEGMNLASLTEIVQGAYDRAHE
jgi:putative aldouronate transport system substrate-binding protein